MVEPEVAFIDLDGLLHLAEEFVSSIAARVLEDNRNELQSLGADIPALERITPPFYRLTYTEAVEILKGPEPRAPRPRAGESAERKAADRRPDRRAEKEQAGQIKQWQKDKIAAELIELRGDLEEVDTRIENNPKHAQLAAEFEWGKDLGGSDETIISQMHDKPVFVTHYPRKAKAFYMRTDRQNEQVVENFDMLAPAGFGEIIGGSVREDDYDRLLARSKTRA